MIKTRPLFIFGLLAFALTIVSCQNDERAARSAAYNYSFAMANYDIDQAEKYSDEETIETTISMARNILPMVDTAYIKSDTPATIEITSVQVTSDTTAVATYLKNTPIKKEMTGTLELRKRHGKWLAHAPIEHSTAATPNTNRQPAKFRLPKDTI